MGLEHLGGDSRSADAEILAVAAECLESLGIAEWVLALGHVGAFHGLVRTLGLGEATADLVGQRVEAKDADGVRAVLAGAGASGPAADALVRLSALAGDRASLVEAAAVLAGCPEAAGAVAELREVVDALVAAGLGDRVAIDLGEVRGLDYYTGLVFRVYARGLGFDVGAGGRYDTLLARFGRPMPAVGFMLGLDRVALLLERRPPAAAEPVVRPETIEGDALGSTLAHARSRRTAGARVRFAAGGGATRRGATR